MNTIKNKKKGNKNKLSYYRTFVAYIYHAVIIYWYIIYKLSI